MQTGGLETVKRDKIEARADLVRGGGMAVQGMETNVLLRRGLFDDEGFTAGGCGIHPLERLLKEPQDA